MHHKVVYIILCTQPDTACALMVLTFTDITYSWTFERNSAEQKSHSIALIPLRDIPYLYTFSDSYNKSSLRISLLHSCELIWILKDGTKQKIPKLLCLLPVLPSAFAVLVRSPLWVTTTRVYFLPGMRPWKCHSFRSFLCHVSFCVPFGL